MDNTARALTRRQAIGAGVTTGIIGGLWVSGMAVVAKGRHPQIHVIGTKGWQCILLEDRNARTLLLVGDADEQVRVAIDTLLGVLKQHVDVVIADQRGLGALPANFMEHRGVSTVILVDGASGIGASSSLIPLVDSLRLSVGSMGLYLRRLRRNEWNRLAEPESTWIGHVYNARITVAFAPTLETIGEHGVPYTALAMAPQGNVSGLQQKLPGISVATNSRSADSSDDDEDYGDTPTYRLTRIFVDEIARFTYRNEQLHLPPWTQSLGDAP